MSSSLPTLSSQPELPAARGRPQLRKWLIAGTVSLALLIVGIIYYQATYVSGLELNSHTWEQRVFALRRDPVTGWQLGGVRHNDPADIDLRTTVANPRAKKLDPSIQKHFVPLPDTPLRWDLVHLDQSELPGARASILVELLAAVDHTQRPLWRSWTRLYPERAAVLWPAAQRLVAADQYTWLPQLFEQALLENSTDEFLQVAGQLVTAALDDQPAGPPSQPQPVPGPAPGPAPGPGRSAQDRQP